MALVSSHYRRDQPATQGADPEQVTLYAQLAMDVLHRIVPRPDQPAFAPQRNHRIPIGFAVLSNIERRHARFLHHPVFAAVGSQSTSSTLCRRNGSPYQSGVAVWAPMLMPAAASRASVGASDAPTQHASGG